MEFAAVLPTLRMHDVSAAKRFYIDWLGCAIDWEDEADDGPVYMQVSRGDLVLHLSSHHDDGTPGSVVLIEMRGLKELHEEIAARPYPFFNPAIGPHPAGRVMEVIDPSSNRLRFFERA
ncbi:MAG: glyoxalase superfamily protein [Actinomycetota bacterium]|nr:glyoxalase superfamily protein [Actinomycetota bacterium]